MQPEQIKFAFLTTVFVAGVQVGVGITLGIMFLFENVLNK